MDGFERVGVLDGTGTRLESQELGFLHLRFSRTLENGTAADAATHHFRANRTGNRNGDQPGVSLATVAPKTCRTGICHWNRLLFYQYEEVVGH